MTNALENNPDIKIKIAKDENLFDLNLCAKDFLDLINNFEKKFYNKKFFVLTAYYNKVLAGILVAEDKSQKVNSLEKILPTMCLQLLFVNSNFRSRTLGKKLLKAFLNIQKEKGIAIIYIKLPQKYKKGIMFFQKNNFYQVGMVRNKIILELYLWNDYGIRDCQLIGNNFNNMFG
ncbi:MAG: GNAT family N-acetyltransferase [Promethearchaeota archaeon]